MCNRLITDLAAFVVVGVVDGVSLAVRTRKGGGRRQLSPLAVGQAVSKVTSTALAQLWRMPGLLRMNRQYFVRF